MRKMIKLFSVGLVLAMVLSVSSCFGNPRKSDNYTEPETQADSNASVSNSVSNSADQSGDDTTTETTKDLSKYKSGDFSNPKVLDLVDLAAYCIGLDGQTCLEHLDETFDFPGSHMKYDSYEGVVSFMGSSFTCDDVPFKSIHIYLKNWKVVEVDYCITEERYFSSAAEGGKDLGDDADLPVKQYYDNISGELNGIFNKPEKEYGVKWFKPSEGKSSLWKAGDISVAATYGTNCFGVEGYNQFELAVSDNKDFKPGYYCVLPVSDEMDEELENLIEIGKTSMGRDFASVKHMIEKKLDITLGDGQQIGDEFSEYVYKDLDFEVSGVHFNMISIISNRNSLTVFDVIFWSDNISSTDCSNYKSNYERKLTAYYGKPTINYYDGDIGYKFDDGLEFWISANQNGSNSYFYVIFKNENLNK